MSRDCELKNCGRSGKYRVKFGPPKVEVYTLCERHAEKMMAFDRSVEGWSDPEIQAEYEVEA